MISNFQLSMVMLLVVLTVAEVDAAKGFQSAINDIAAKTQAEQEDRCMEIVKAARAGNLDFIRGKGGMDINCKDKHGYAPIHHASRKGRSKFLQAMLDMKADVTMQKSNGWTALHEAAYWGQYKAVKLLLKAGSDPNARSKDGQVPLHVAAQSQSKRSGKITSSLIKSGGDVNAIDKKGWVPLHYAVENLKEPALKRLLRAGCDPNAKEGKTKESPLEFAKSKPHFAKVLAISEEHLDNTKGSL